MNELEALRNAVSQTLGLGSNITTERAIELLVQNFGSLTSYFSRTTYFFPEYADLYAITVYAPPPQKGDTIYVKDLEIKDEYSKWISWQVKHVDYSIQVTADSKARLKMLIAGRQPNTQEAQVHLYKGRKWADAHK